MIKSNIIRPLKAIGIYLLIVSGLAGWVLATIYLVHKIGILGAFVLPAIFLSLLFILSMYNSLD